MKRLILIVLLASSCSQFPPRKSQSFVSMQIAPACFRLLGALQNLQRQGVTLTPEIAQEICDGMKAGRDPQCIRVEADDFRPIASGSDGALAMSDGKTKVWFHNPDAGGWVHPDYYIYYLDTKSPTARR